MGFAELELVPDGGRVDLAAIEAHLRGVDHAFVDPHDPRCWFLCADAETSELHLEARIADPSRRPYTLLLLLEPARVWLVGEFADTDELAVGRRLVEWLLAQGGAWRARDAAYSGPWAAPLSFF